MALVVETVKRVEVLHSRKAGVRLRQHRRRWSGCSPGAGPPECCHPDRCKRPSPAGSSTTGRTCSSQADRIAAAMLCSVTTWHDQPERNEADHRSWRPTRSPDRIATLRLRPSPIGESVLWSFTPVAIGRRTLSRGRHLTEWAYVSSSMVNETWYLTSLTDASAFAA